MRRFQKQKHLPGIKVANHSKRGDELEKALERTHGEYLFRRLADVRKNPQQWNYVSDRWLLKHPQPPSRIATCGDGQKMIRVKTSVDYVGGGRNFSIKFDAKDSAGVSIPLNNFSQHQIDEVRDAVRCGMIAGFLICFYEQDAIYFASGELIQSVLDDYQFRNGRASIPIKTFEEKALKIPVKDNLINWYPVLVK
jgi:recombination protein U